MFSGRFVPLIQKGKEVYTIGKLWLKARNGRVLLRADKIDCPSSLTNFV
jgi:hypothetical protein